MKYTAAQLRLLNEAEWGWASRGEEPPPPPEPKPKRKLSRSELKQHHKRKQQLFRKAQHSDIADELLKKQEAANAARARREKEEG